MTNSARLYRFGFTPWERYGSAAAASIAAKLDREEAERPLPPGRALDLGCSRGQHTPSSRVAGGTWRASTTSRLRSRQPGAVTCRGSRGEPRRVFEQEVVTAFPGWALLSSEPAETVGLGWPMNRTRPRWYRLGRAT
jgi:hypothetical protein